jgi:tRNA-binding EMAP/Myf-like protein
MAEITLDAVKAEIEKNPDLKKSVIGILKEDFIKGAESEGMIIRTKEQDQQYVQSQINVQLPTKVQEEVGKKFKEMLDPIDAEILSITGIAKKEVNGAPGEKTTEYAKRAFTEFHKKGGGDSATKQRVEELEKILLQKEQTYTQEKEKLTTQLFETEVNSQLDADLERKQIFVPPHITKEEDKQRYIQDQKKAAKQSFLGAYKGKRDEQGNLIWYENDKPLLDTKDGKPRKAGSILDERFSTWFVPAGKEVTGTGTGQGGNTGVANGAFKNKEDIHKHLATQGMDALSSQYMEQFEKIATENKIAI